MSSIANATESSGPGTLVTTQVPAVDARPGTTPPFFSPDAPGEDLLGRAAQASFLAQVVAHRGAGTPFLIGLFGSAGSGKSAFLGQVLEAVTTLSDGPRDGRASGAFVPGIVTVRVDAATQADLATAILAKVFSALGRNHPTLAEDAIHAGGDPVKAARAAGERVNDLRGKLDTERQALEAIEGRRSRLAETVLFDSPGSRVDAYARANRGRIETRLRAFGLPVTDAVASFKDHVRAAAEGGGSASRWALLPRAMWNYKRQAALIVLAILLFLLAWLSGTLADNQPGLQLWLSGLGDRFSGVAGWTRDHLSWLLPLGRAALVLAALVLLANLWRAFRFLQPIAKGASLLAGDLEERRRDLEGLLAHQTRRVEHISAEVDAAARSADRAERRVEARHGGDQADPQLTVAGGDLAPKTSTLDVARAFFEVVSAAMGNDRRTLVPAGQGPATAPLGSEAGPAAPDRIVVAIDGLDRLPGPAAAAMLEAAHHLLGRPHFVTIAAAERSHLLAGLSETDPALAWARLDRAVQLSYDLDADTVSSDALAGSLLDGRTGAPGAPVDTRGLGLEAPLEAPLQPFETDLVRALAPLASGTPRGIKRFVNTYRVARADPRLADATPAELGGLAAALALEGGGGGFDLWNTGPDRPGADADMAATSDFGRAMAAVRSAVGADFNVRDARRGLLLARTYGRRG